MNATERQAVEAIREYLEQFGIKHQAIDEREQFIIPTKEADDVITNYRGRWERKKFAALAKLWQIAQGEAVNVAEGNDERA